MAALTREQFLAGYLRAEDLPGMQLVQDSRTAGAGGDPAFAAHGGTDSGLAAFMGPDDARIWRLVDIRFAFADERSATAYHRERLRENAEGMPAVRGAPLVGAGCAAFGGVSSVPFAPQVVITMYCYLFRVGQVLVKLHATQSPHLPAGTLEPADLTPIARAAEARITAAVPGPPSGGPRAARAA